MSYRYAISDPHGCLGVLAAALDALDLTGNNRLYLLGDYLPHETPDMGRKEYVALSARALSLVREFEACHPHNVTVLAGNHELYLLELERAGEVEISPSLHTWLRRLPHFAQTEEQVFVHAGVDEEAGDLWSYASEDWYYCNKFPATFGSFYKDIVAGHVGAASLADSPDFEGVFWDGQSHYYIDGSTEESGMLPILRYDVERHLYQQQLATAGGVSAPAAIDAQLW